MPRFLLVSVPLLASVLAVASPAASEETFRWEVRGAREDSPDEDIPLSTTFDSQAAAERELRQKKFDYYDKKGLLASSPNKPVGLYVMKYFVEGGVLRPAADSMAFGDKVSSEFRARVFEISQRLKIPADYLMTVMAIETSKSVNGRMMPTFNPSIKNPGSSAVGLIQFMKATAEDLGTTTEKLAEMSAVDQLDYVEKYLKPHVGKMKQVEDVYLAVFYPQAIGKGGDFEFPDSIYGPNKGLDKDRNGKLTKGEIAAFVRRTLERGMRNKK